MTDAQRKRMDELKRRVWAHHTWHINLALGIEHVFQAQRARDQAARVKRIEREKFEEAKPKLDALIADLKAQRAQRMSRDWTAAQLEARAVARDCLLDGRLGDAAVALHKEQMCLGDMVTHPRTKAEVG